MKNTFLTIALLLLYTPCAWAFGGSMGGPVAGGGGPLVYWDAGDTSGTETLLSTYQENSGTISSTGVDFTPTGHDSTGHAAYVDGDGVLSFQCTDGTSIDLDKGTIKFSFKKRGNIDQYGILFALGTGSSDFLLRYYSQTTSSNYIQFRYNGNRVNFAISTMLGDEFGVQNDVLYNVQLDWDNNSEAEIHRLTINEITDNGTWASGTSLGAKPAISTPTMYLGNEGAQTYSSISEFDDVYIYNTVQTP